MNQPFIPFARPCIEQEDISNVVDVLTKGWLSKGPQTDLFEKAISKYVQSDYALGLNSCTAALHLGLLVNGIGPGDEVITSPYTFCASANVIAHVGATPVFIDIRDDFNMEPLNIEAAITDKTKAIIVVHIGGGCCEMDTIMDIANRHNLIVIEDAAHAIAAEYDGKHAGTFGHMGAFSFYATKNLTTGEGGMLVTDQKELVDAARVLSLHGMSQNAWNRYEKGGSWQYAVEAPGYKYNMTDIQAALGLAQLDKLSDMQKRREEIATQYTKAFDLMPEIMTPVVYEKVKHAWHLYAIRVQDHLLCIHRNQFIEELKKRNIGTSVHFIPLHLQPFYQQTYGYKEGDFPVAERAFQQEISLPIYPSMTDEEVQRVISAVQEIVKQNRKCA